MLYSEKPGFQLFISRHVLNLKELKVAAKRGGMSSCYHANPSEKTQRTIKWSYLKLFFPPNNDNLKAMPCLLKVKIILAIPL